MNHCTICKSVSRRLWRRHAFRDTIGETVDPSNINGLASATGRQNGRKALVKIQTRQTPAELDLEAAPALASAAAIGQDIDIVAFQGRGCVAG
jgi:hypothetical protein